MTNNMSISKNSGGISNFTLHVANLPLDLEKDGVTNIFLEYGNVTGVIIIKGKNNSNQAYISYSMYNEAESAINSLHQKLPLMLTVEFKDKSLKNKQNVEEIDLSHPFNDFRYKDSFLDHGQGSKKLIEIGRANCSPICQSQKYSADDELLYPVPDDLSVFNPYEPAGLYRDTNLMYTRGVAVVSKDGRTRVSCGRGYIYYNLPEPKYNIEEYLQNVCEKRENGYYEYTSEIIPDDTGICKICSTPTAFRCQKCGVTFYCNKTCQISDWSQHKLECQPVPPLIKKVIKKALSPNNSETLLQSQEEPHIGKCAQLRRPKIIQQESNALGGSSKCKESPSSVQDLHGNNKSLRNIIETVESRKNCHMSNEKDRNGFNTDPKNFTEKSEILQQKTSQNPNDHLHKPSENNIVFEPELFIPKDKFIDVMITTALDGGEYWVQKVDDSDEIENLFLKLQKYADHAKFVDPEENVKCILQHNDMWFRATIISVEPKSLKVFYNDFGTVENVNAQQVCPINGFENLPATYCRRIRLVDEAETSLKELKYAKILSVKMVNVTADGTIIVQALPGQNINQVESLINDKILKDSSIDGNSPCKNTQLSPAFARLENIPNVLDTLKVGQVGLAVLHAELAQGEFNMSLVPENMMDDFESLLDELKNDCEREVTKNSNYIPKVGDAVCGQSIEHEWFRGVILSTKPIVKLAVIDESRIFVPIKCIPTPTKYSSINSMGLVCKFIPNTKLPKEKLETADFSVVEILRESAKVNLAFKSLSFTGTVIIKKWTPKSEQKGIQWASLTSGQEVLITYFSNQNLIYVRSLETKEIERAHLLEQEVAKCALNPEPLSEMPVVGQMVMAYFMTDENYYRAIVIKVENNKVILKYVDYGNEEVTTIDKLFVLSDTLKECPSAVSKIKLKDINTDIPLTQEAAVYFQELISNGVHLTCNFIGHPYKDGVVLKTTRNENVNDILKGLLEPTWEKMNSKEDAKIYEILDLPNLKLGDVGDEVEAVVLCYYRQNGTLILAPNDYVAAQAIHGQMKQRISEYVEATISHYIPRDKELCIAKYDDAYYRALCLESSCSPTESRVYFIDYGNTERVNHTDIRIFTEDFTNFGSLGNLCSLSSMVQENKFNDKISDRISELIPINDIITIKIISIDDDGIYNIDVPKIRMKLIEEKFI